MPHSTAPHRTATQHTAAGVNEPLSRSYMQETYTAHADFSLLQFIVFIAGDRCDTSNDWQYS